MEPTALLICPESPFPTIGGGALRTASLFEFLSRHFRLDVITFRQPHDPDPRSAFPLERMRSLHVINLPFHAKSRLPRLARNLKRAALNRPPLLDRFSGFERQIAAAVAGQSYELGVIEHFWCAPYQAQLRPVCRNLILDLHNIESEWHASLASCTPGMPSLLHQRFSQVYRERERAFLPLFDILLTTSRRDADRVRDLAPGRKCVVFPNAIPWVARPQKDERDEIIFTGNLEYQPNISAIAWFKKEIWPEVRSRFPDLTWIVAGKNGQAVQQFLAGQPHIEICPLADAVSRIAQCKVAVVPLLAGSGTRLKILESWAAVTPVVSTSLGAEGLEAVSGEHLIVTDRPADFSHAISNLLINSGERSRVGAGGRQLYETSYTCERAWQALDFLIGV